MDTIGKDLKDCELIDLISDNNKMERAGISWIVFQTDIKKELIRRWKDSEIPEDDMLSVYNIIKFYTEGK